MMNRFVFESFFYALPKYTNIMTDEGLIFLMNVLPDVYISFHKKKSSPLLPEGTVKSMYTSSSITNSQGMQTEIKESGSIAKIRI